MWLFTPTGAYSIVEPSFDDPDFRSAAWPGDLVVRARSAEDLDNFRDKWCPELRRTITIEGRDYGFRAFVNRDDLAKAVARFVLSIDYTNFKNQVTKQQGLERAIIYHRIWDALADVEYGPRREWVDYLDEEEIHPLDDEAGNDGASSAEAA